MSESKVICPNCGTPIDVNKILTHQLEEQLRVKHSAEFAAKNKEIEDQKLKLTQETLALEEKKKKENLMFQEKLDQKMKEQREAVELEVKTKLLAEQEDQFKSLQKELNEKSDQLKELNKTKADFEKLKREKEELNDKIVAETEKKLTEQLSVEKEKIKRQAEEENKLKLLQLQKQLDDQKKLTEDMKRKQEQGSMQLQGEVQELAIEDELRQIFPFDRIEEVSKGIRGADCIQTVINPFQEACGKIIYESKRTANFGGDWIEKLKGDMLSAGADVAVLITQTLPRGQQSFTMVDGVWVCSFSEYKSLSLALREGVLKVSSALKSNENKGDKMHLLYSYLTGNEFRHQIEAIIGAFQTLEEDLAKEKRAMQQIWKKREKQIEKVIANTAGLYGTVRGIAGSGVKSIEALELGDSENLLEEGSEEESN